MSWGVGGERIRTDSAGLELRVYGRHRHKRQDQPPPNPTPPLIECRDFQHQRLHPTDPMIGAILRMVPKRCAASQALRGLGCVISFGADGPQRPQSVSAVDRRPMSSGISRGGCNSFAGPLDDGQDRRVES